MKTYALAALLGLAFTAQAQAVQTLDLATGTAGGDVLATSTSLFMTTALNADDDNGINFNLSGGMPLMAGGDLETVAGHPAGEYDIDLFDNSGSMATEGSVYVLKNVVINAGDTLSFAWTFYTNEPEMGGMKDAAYFSVLNHFTTVLANAADGITGDAGLSGYRAATSGSFNYTFTSAGSYDLVFAVVDTDDSITSSALMINDATITPVPEAETYALMLAGLGLVGLMVKRSKRRFH